MIAQATCYLHVCIIITPQDHSIMHESDYPLADYKLTPLPLLYLKCNLNSEETKGNVCTINLSDVWGLNAIEQNRRGRLLMTS